MTTIWFRLHGSSGALSVAVNPVYAAEVWHRLSQQFEMVSQQP